MSFLSLAHSLRHPNDVTTSCPLEWYSSLCTLWILIFLLCIVRYVIILYENRGLDIFRPDRGQEPETKDGSHVPRLPEHLHCAHLRPAHLLLWGTQNN